MLFALSWNFFFSLDLSVTEVQREHVKILLFDQINISPTPSVQQAWRQEQDYPPALGNAFLKTKGNRFSEGAINGQDRRFISFDQRVLPLRLSHQ